MWIAVVVSVISLATALYALRRAHLAEAQVAGLIRTGRAGIDPGIPWQVDELVIGEPSQRQLVAATLNDGDSLSNACHVVIRALDEGVEPPSSTDYGRVQRCSDHFTASVGRSRASPDGDLVRRLTDDLVTLHHSLVTEVRQHQQARFPFVGARDTAVAGLVLRRFDAELARLRHYADTGSIPESDVVPVDFETVRFVPRAVPREAPPPSPPDSP